MLSVDVFEITQCLVDAGDVGKGVRELAQDLLEPDDLVAVHHADQQGPGGVGVHALGGQHRDAVVELLQEPGGKLRGVAGDHLEFQGALAALEDTVTDAGA